jgi:hypothetical protein
MYIGTPSSIFIHLSNYLSVCLAIYLSIYLSIYLCMYVYSYVCSIITSICVFPHIYMYMCCCSIRVYIIICKVFTNLSTYSRIRFHCLVGILFRGSVRKCYLSLCMFIYLIYNLYIYIHICLQVPSLAPGPAETLVLYNMSLLDTA